MFIKNLKKRKKNVKKFVVGFLSVGYFHVVITKG